MMLHLARCEYLLVTNAYDRPDLGLMGVWWGYCDIYSGLQWAVVAPAVKDFHKVALQHRTAADDTRLGDLCCVIPPVSALYRSGRREVGGELRCDIITTAMV